MKLTEGVNASTFYKKHVQLTLMHTKRKTSSAKLKLWLLYFPWLRFGSFGKPYMCGLMAFLHGYFSSSG